MEGVRNGWGSEKYGLDGLGATSSGGRGEVKGFNKSGLIKIGVAMKRACFESGWKVVG